MKAKVLFAGLCFVAVSAHAEPRAGSAEECYAFADLALVASTLAKHGVTRERTEIMLPEIYDINTADGRELTRRIVEAAYREDGKQPRSFAAKIGNGCLQNGGSLEAALGTSL